MQVKKAQLELDMEKLTGSKLEKEDVKAAYFHPSYLTYIQSTLCEMPGWMKHKLESIFPGEISIPYIDNIYININISITYININMILYIYIYNTYK